MARDIAAQDAFQNVFNQCISQKICGGATPEDNKRIADELQRIVADKDVLNQMARAWTMSFGHSGRWEVHEHGFWIGRRGSDYYARPIQEASRARPWSIIAGPSYGTDIFFHTHPFADRWSGFSSGDTSTARIRDIFSIVYSHDGFYLYDAR